jgi:hypothetical protein
VSYLGSVTMSRGCDTMIEVGRELRRRTNGAVTLEVIGEAADPEARHALQSAAAAGISAGVVSYPARLRWPASVAPWRGYVCCGICRIIG